MHANMAATLFRALAVFYIFTFITMITVERAYRNQSLTSRCISWMARFELRVSRSRNLRVRRAMVKWDSRGMVFLAAPEKFVVLDITVNMDVHPHPGPEEVDNDHGKRKQSSNSSDSACQPAIGSVRIHCSHNRDRLLSLRRSAGRPAPHVFDTLKSLGILKYRGPGLRRLGKITKNISASQHSDRCRPIEVVKTRRFARPYRFQDPAKNRYLTAIPREPTKSSTDCSEFAVPKCMFINICSLAKTKNKVRAAVGLEADLRSKDIDVCVVSETHLKPAQPDAIVNIENYSIFRRDRNWNGRDMRNKGGIAIYIRNNLAVEDVYRSSLYELICITLRLPKGHRFVICGVYHPPKFNYAEIDLMNHLVNTVDNILDKHPQTVVLCGGDVNKLDIKRFEEMSGWNALVNFPTRGNSCLDNCFTNRTDLFSKCYPFHMLSKTDHMGVILPPGIKLPPIRRKVYVRDQRAHRKRDLYIALAKENWDDMIQETDVDEVVGRLENTILGHLDSCMPLKAVRMSSRDPGWMTPLVRSMIRAKSRISLSNQDRLKVMNKRISEVIFRNRRDFIASIGTRDWWKKVDKTSQRRKPVISLSLGHYELNALNDYFGDLCTDHAYRKPTPLEISEDQEVPEISERQVLNSLMRIKKTATGPDGIPYTIWKDHAELFVPVITWIWNLSLRTHAWPVSWKKSDLYPLPKVDIPKGISDFRGINVTPVIARCFEKAVLGTHARETFDEHSGISQFAYIEGGSCTNALLTIQHTVNQYLDIPECKAVRLFAMDFSKAFDSVKHDLLSHKLKQLPLNPFIVNWYLSFLEDRQQRVIRNGFIGKWKSVNKGTTQGSVSGPHLFNVFLSDLEIHLDNKSVLVKYADDTTIISPVIGDNDNSIALINQFSQWSRSNGMCSNPSKCKEIIFRKKGCTIEFPMVSGIPQTKELTILGVTFQEDSRFITHIREKLIKANKCLFILRSLRKEGYNQAEIDHLFLNLVLPNILYGLSVFGAVNSELTTIQCFLDRCYKRKYTSDHINVYELLVQQDTRIFKNVFNNTIHPLRAIMPKKKLTKYNLRKETSHHPKINTDRFKNTFVNRLIFKHNLVL